MPVYEYECPACENVLEVQQRMSDEPLDTCSLCGAGGIKKLVSRSAFHLKGGGWYSDGYSSATKGQNEKKEGTKKTSGNKTANASPSRGDACGDKCKQCPSV
ncbi:MAG: zinc ribbon domain-containing protein [Candidatus Electrothrix sp. AR3]|nr:zinc ribbon domain-containing protein [Candidatus Electrothrix sp. AR3]